MRGRGADGLSVLAVAGRQRLLVLRPTCPNWTIATPSSRRRTGKAVVAVMSLTLDTRGVSGRGRRWNRTIHCLLRRLFFTPILSFTG